ncbi:DUF3576 domain-containing protein [Paracoccus jeotgali]|uniref:DUF3576 domain-containing protein n=1 Tax=Paracoccus jeotgali TaxID=2065379 RepID=UPI0028AD3C5A|nr:DUF3576 domain-containing protein [Paracoccus jeotgali]
MTRFAFRAAAILVATLSLSACGGGGVFGGGKSAQAQAQQQGTRASEARESTIWDLFSNRQSPNNTVAVNKYLWNASLDVLNFLPIQAIDPYTGVIVTGYGTPPGGRRSYRATIHITDPALDARSLRLSLQGPGGAAVAPGTAAAVEDAILTRARQLRVADGKL